MNSLIITGEMTDLNTYINENRTNKFVAARTKKTETERVAWECKIQKIPRFQKIFVSYNICITNDRKDEDNLLIAIKWINDGLVMAQVIPDDSPKHLHIQKISFTYWDEAQIIVDIEGAK